MIKQACVMGLFASLLFAAAKPATAQTDRDGLVAVGGEEILTVRFPAAGMSVKERADAITDRLRIILSDPHLAPEDITAVALGPEAAKIMVRGRLLITVDSRTARYNQAKPIQLARAWVQNLRRVLPKVNVRPNPPLDGPDGDGRQTR